MSYEIFKRKVLGIFTSYNETMKEVDEYKEIEQVDFNKLGFSLYTREFLMIFSFEDPFSNSCYILIKTFEIKEDDRILGQKNKIEIKDLEVKVHLDFIEFSLEKDMKLLGGIFKDKHITEQYFTKKYLDRLKLYITETKNN